MAHANLPNTSEHRARTRAIKADLHTQAHEARMRDFEQALDAYNAAMLDCAVAARTPMLDSGMDLYSAGVRLTHARAALRLCVQTMSQRIP